MFHDKNWWKNAVIYQIYPRSFYDTNDDGIGDIQGIIQKLDYIKSLNVDAIWLCPVCTSPDVDNGYDCSNYLEIDPRYGTNQDMSDLIAAAGEREMGIIIDLVLNHTSDQHRWFQNALTGRDAKFRDFYIWGEGTTDHYGNRLPPNDLQSNFGGSAWEYHRETDQFYLHLHDKSQPDLNWSNPQVRDALYGIVQFWIDQGVAGFRLDVIDLIGKEPFQNITQNGPKMHDYIHELAGKTFAGQPVMTIGETWGATPEEALKFIAPERQELNMVFQFEPMQLDKQAGGQRWDLAPLDKLAFKKNYLKWQTSLRNRGWNALFANNHDLPRVVSRWGNDREYRAQSAKALAAVLYLMQGTPFIYQGEEIGMTNIPYDSIDDFIDIETINTWHERKQRGIAETEILTSLRAKCRENGRTPMQWNSQPYAGFSTASPWYAANPNYPEINVAIQESDQHSILNFYRTLLQYRKENPVIRDGEFQLLLTDHPDIFAYQRATQEQSVWVIANLSDRCTSWAQTQFKEPGRKIMFSNYPTDHHEIQERMTHETIRFAPWELWVIEG
ncbi:glycoside hydrolase family 13 protein [Vibrio mangrovi]|uniref:Alpha-glucosidase n=1 Tax=Vibrio mangrovi TaxID=474394 RepID=A0A1Y6IZ21_9VIBR|nr:alpha-glucosidase [Vibrio mangrovi]MDW6005261.1 alpha-glucosidase [Vibrio mangrovi]SMS02886.1 Oligo-1,6-glucosidase [Vibrio mangrovi]